MFTRTTFNTGGRLKIKKTSDKAYVFYSTYYDSPEDRFGGHILCVTTDSDISDKSPAHPEHWVKYHHLQSESIYTSSHGTHIAGKSKEVIWLVLMGLQYSTEDDWESFEPTCVGAAWDVATAKKIQNDVDQGGNTVVMGFPDGWIYGRDEIPAIVRSNAEIKRRFSTRYSNP